MALENNKTITLHLNDSNRKILEPIAEEAQAKGISLSAAVIEKLTALSKPLADPIIVETPEPVEEVENPFDADINNTETETEAETPAVESNDSHVTKITLNLTAFSDEDEYYKVKIEREDGTSETMEWVPDEVADDGDNTEENVLQLISNNNISPETHIAVEVLAEDVDVEIDDDEEEEERVIARTATLADLGSKAVRKQLGFNDEEDEIYSDLKEILKALKDLEQLREDYPMGQVAEVEAIRDDDDYDEDEDEEYDEDDEEEYDEDEDDYDEEEDEDEDEEREYGNGGSYDDYPW